MIGWHILHDEYLEFQMTVFFLKGDLFLSRAQTLAHGVNCRGRMGAGIAVEFRRWFPAMYKEYRRRCHKDILKPGEFFLWKEDEPWVLNLATQADTGGANLSFVREVLTTVAARYVNEGITSLAMPRIAAGLGGCGWGEVRGIIEETFAVHPLPVYVYEEYVEGEEAEEPLAHLDEVEEPVLFHGTRHPRWCGLSNFARAPFEVNGVQYPTVEHFYQAAKAVTAWEHDMVRTAASPRDAKKQGRRVQLRPDWEEVKIEVMRMALLAKFQQNAELRELLLSSGDCPIHEDSPSDAVWGWMNGGGRDLLGRLLMEVRAVLRKERDEHKV